MFRPGLSSFYTKMIGANPQTLCNLPIDKSFGLCYNKYTKKKRGKQNDSYYKAHYTRGFY